MANYFFRDLKKIFYLLQCAILQVLMENRSKFVLVHASSGFKHSLKGKIYLNIRSWLSLLVIQQIFLVLISKIVLNSQRCFKILQFKLGCQIQKRRPK